MKFKKLCSLSLTVIILLLTSVSAYASDSNLLIEELKPQVVAQGSTIGIEPYSFIQTIRQSYTVLDAGVVCGAVFIDAEVSSPTGSAGSYYYTQFITAGYYPSNTSTYFILNSYTHSFTSSSTLYVVFTGYLYNPITKTKIKDLTFYNYFDANGYDIV